MPIGIDRVNRVLSSEHQTVPDANAKCSLLYLLKEGEVCMYAALGFKFFVTPLAVVGVIIFAGLITFFPPATPGELFRHVGFTTTIVGILVFVIGTRVVFWWMLGVLERIGIEIFPNINGT
jgi:hypothetical protein